MSDEFDTAKTASAEGLYDVEVVKAAAFQLLYSSGWFILTQVECGRKGVGGGRRGGGEGGGGSGRGACVQRCGGRKW